MPGLFYNKIKAAIQETISFYKTNSVIFNSKGVVKVGFFEHICLKENLAGMSQQ